MTIRAELYNGTVLEFPDGTSSDVISAAARRMTQQFKDTEAGAKPAATQSEYQAAVAGLKSKPSLTLERPRQQPVKANAPQKAASTLNTLPADDSIDTIYKGVMQTYIDDTEDMTDINRRNYDRNVGRRREETAVETDNVIASEREAIRATSLESSGIAETAYINAKKRAASLGAGVARTTAEALIENGFDPDGDIIAWALQRSRNIEDYNARNIDGAQTWDDLKENPSLGGLAKLTIENLGAVGVDSLAFGNPATVGLWISGQGGNLAQTRAENNGGINANAQSEDFLVGIPVAIVSAGLEKLGLMGIFGKPAEKLLGKMAEKGGQKMLVEAIQSTEKYAVGRIAVAAGAEGITEALQSPLEYAATNLGTKAGFSGADALDQTLQGFVLGSSTGGVLRGGVEIASIPVRKTAPGKIEQSAVVEISEGDNDSPISNETIAAGKAMAATAVGSREADAVLERAGVAKTGARVSVQMPDGKTRIGTISDAFDEDVEGERATGVVIDFDDGTRLREHFDTLTDAGVGIEPLSPTQEADAIDAALAAAAQASSVAMPVDGPVAQSSATPAAASAPVIAKVGPSILSMPVQGRVSSGFGPRKQPKAGASKNHGGIDFAVPVGTDVAVAADGVVKRVFFDKKGGGNVVEVDHGGGVLTQYMHLKGAKVAAGTQVKNGQIIAASGNTGNSTGPHLHFAMKVNGKNVDPNGYFGKEIGGGTATADGSGQALAPEQEDTAINFGAMPDFGRSASLGKPEDTQYAQVRRGEPINVTAEDKADTAVTASGREVPVRYAVAELSDLITSNDADGRRNPDYPQDLQPRDRSRGISAAQISGIAGNLNPRLIGRSPKASDGAPIIAPDGVVESGNGRTLALASAYRTGGDKIEAYKAMIAEEGFDTANFREPVLVRVRDGELSQSDVQAFTREANARDTLDMSATETAMADSEAMSSGMLEMYRGGDIDAAGNREFVRQFLTGVVSSPNDYAKLIDGEGRLSQGAVQRVRGAMLARAYGNKALAGQAIESTDTEIKTIINALTDVSGQWANMRAAAADGRIDKALDITTNLNEAIGVVDRARREGKRVADLVGQRDIFTGQAVSPVTEAVLRLFFSKPDFTRATGRERVVTALNFYAEEAMKASADGAALFDMPAVKPTGVLDLARVKQGNVEETSDTDLFRQDAASKPAEPARSDASETGRDSQRPDGEGVSPDSGEQTGRDVDGRLRSTALSGNGDGNIAELGAIAGSAETDRSSPNEGNNVEPSRRKIAGADNDDRGTREDVLAVVDANNQAKNAKHSATERLAFRVGAARALGVNSKDQGDLDAIVKEWPAAALRGKAAANTEFKRREKAGPSVVKEGLTTEPVSKADELPTAPEQTSADLTGDKIKGEWVAFADDSGSLGIPRAEMPQIKAEHRGALVNFLNARGIAHEEISVPASELKPTQAEFSTKKVNKAKEYEGGNRAILSSSDGHVLDGHHQWLGAMDNGEAIRSIKLDAPIRQLLDVVAEFPSAETAAGAVVRENRTVEKVGATGANNAQVDKKNPNPFVRTGEQFRFSERVNYLGGRNPEEIYTVERASKIDAYFRGEYGSGSSLKSYLMQKAIADGVMTRVQKTSDLTSQNESAPPAETAENRQSSYGSDNNAKTGSTAPKFKAEVGDRLVFTGRVETTGPEDGQSAQLYAVEYTGRKAIFLRNEATGETSSLNWRSFQQAVAQGLVSRVDAPSVVAEQTDVEAGARFRNDFERDPETTLGYLSTDIVSAIAEKLGIAGGVTGPKGRFVERLVKDRDADALRDAVFSVVDNSGYRKTDEQPSDEADATDSPAPANDATGEPLFDESGAQIGLFDAETGVVTAQPNRNNAENDSQIEVLSKLITKDVKESRVEEPVAVLTGAELGKRPKNDALRVRIMRDRANQYYRENFEGKTVKGTDGVEVTFGRHGRKKTTSGKGEDVLNALPALRAIIEKGDIKALPPRRNDMSAWLYSATVRVGDADMRLAAIVREDANGRRHYNLTKDVGSKSSVGSPGEAVSAVASELEIEVSSDADINLFRVDQESNAGNSADMQALRQQMQRLGIQDKVALRVTENLGAMVAGRFTPVDTAGLRGLIEIAASDLQPKSFTLNHESIHAMRSLGLFRDAEWASLSNRAKSDLTLMRSVKRRYASLSADAQIEEAVAELFASWARDRGQKGLAARGVERIVDFVRALRQWIAGNGWADAGQVLRAIEGGDVGGRTDGQQQGVATGSRLSIVENYNTLFRNRAVSEPEEASSSKSVVFNNPETEARFQKAREGIGTTQSLTERVKEFGERAWHGISRHWIELPNTAEYADLQQKLRAIESAPQTAKERTVRMLESLVADFSNADLDLFTRKAILDDLYWDASNDRQLPFGFTVETLNVEKNKVDAAVWSQPDKKVWNALAKRKVANRKMADELVAAGVLEAEQIRNPAYYRHQVLEYAIAEQKRAASASGTGARLRSPKWAKRMGSSLDINANLLEAEFDWLNKALTDIPIANTIEWIKKSKHNILGQLQSDARANNKAGVEAALENAAETLSDRLSSADEKVAAQLLIDTEKGFRRAIAMGFDNVRSVLERDQVKVPKQFASAAVAIEGQSSTADDAPFGFLSWLLDENQPGAMGAAMILKAIGQRRSWTSNLLGKAFVDPNDAAALAKRLAPEGYTTWQPDEGKLLFTVKTIPEHVIDRMIEQLEAPSGWDADAFRAALEGARSAFAMGGSRYTMILPNEVADTLNNLKRVDMEGLFDLLVQKPVRAWKRWVLMNPRRFFKYNLNNLTGDLDALIAGNPRSLRRVGEAAKELAAVMRGKAQPSQRYQEAVERGVFDSGLSIQEIPDLHLMEPFERFSNKAGPISKLAILPLRKAWNVLQGTTQWRENIFRYAAYLDYADRIEAGESQTSIGYGGSVPKMVDAVTDNRDKAALLARDLIGDYGAISHYGAGLRNTIIPFWSWMEINTKRYWRLTSNAYSQGVGKGIATGGGLAAVQGVKASAWLGVRMAMVYGLMTLWNNMFFGDEEDELDENQRRQLHIILGRNDEGEIITLRTQGAASDAISWFGLGATIDAAHEYELGRGSIWSILTAPPKAVINKIGTAVSPALTLPIESATGKKLWPDLFDTRQNRDEWRNVFSTFSLENEYDAFNDKPSRGYGRSWEEAVIYRRDPGEMAYNAARGTAYDWLEREKGQAFEGGFASKRGDAARDYRTAQKFGDQEAADKALQEMADLGVSKGDFEAMIKRAHPLGPIAKKDRQAFVDQLTDKELETFKRAEIWYRDTMAII